MRREKEAACYWISSASLGLHTKQSAANAHGQRDGGGRKRDQRRGGKKKGLKLRGRQRHKTKEADDGMRREREPKIIVKEIRKEIERTLNRKRHNGTTRNFL